MQDCLPCWQPNANRPSKGKRAAKREPYEMEVVESKPFWVEKCSKGVARESWVDFVRMRKLKNNIMITIHHYNRDDKKELHYLNICHLVPTPPDAKRLAYFFKLYL